ncbi:unnamed protein product [Mesocestoides corti]|nr:unnamed protein product [Mesocestoides corti]
MSQEIPVLFPLPECEKHDPSNSSPLAFFQSASNILNGDAQKHQRVDFLHGWPVSLVHIFRFGKLDKCNLEALYCESGSFADLQIMYLAEFPSFCGPSRILRYLHYCLLRGIEEANGLLSKMIGLRPHAREICYDGSFRYKSYLIHVGSISLPPNCSADDFLNTFFGYQPSPDIPDWCGAVILACLIWHCQKLDTPEHKNCDVTECPVVLAVIIIAVVNNFNVQGDNRALFEHYNSLKLFAKSQVNKTEPPEIDAEKLVFHNLLELMSTYSHYLSLHSLLTALQTKDQIPDFDSAAYNRFPALHVVFPSLHLAVQVALILRSQPTPSVASRFWLTKVFFRSSAFSSVARFNEITALFLNLLKFMSTVTLKWQPPEVNITNPPSCFVPKSERLRNNQNVHCSSRPQKKFAQPPDRNLRPLASRQMVKKPTEFYSRDVANGPQKVSASCNPTGHNFRPQSSQPKNFKKGGRSVSSYAARLAKRMESLNLEK